MEAGAQPTGATPYPVQLQVEYPDRDLNRLTTGFRLILAIPILIVAAAVSSARSLLFLPPLLLIVFRQKYPRWWYDWNLQFQRFSTRVTAYFLLMDDRYPATDEEQYVHLDFPYPDVERDLHRGLPLVKWFLAIPHYIALLFLYIGVFFVAIFAWFAILFTGRYPRGAFDYIEGVLRWSARVLGYAFILITDRYPPFRLRP